MKRQVPVLALGLILFAAVDVRPQSERWLRYMVPGEEFSVGLPMEPSLKTSQVFVARVNKNRLERVLQARRSGLVYSVYIYENVKPRQSLEDFIAEQNADARLDPATERTVILGNSRGKQYASANTKTVEQFFATEKRLYRFVVAGETNQSWRVTTFFSSIVIGKRPDGFEVLEGPSPDEGLEEVVLSNEVGQKPRVLRKPEPSYTVQAREKEIEGTVILRVIFSAAGRISNIRVVQELPYGLTEQAIAAARQIKFVPAVKDGKNVSVWMQLEYNFNLD